MNYFITIAILIVLSFLNYIPASGENAKVVTRINGSVDGRKSNDAAWTPIFTSRPLLNGDWARTHSDSFAKIYLEGGRHFIKLYENTLVEMSKVEGEGANRFIQLKQTLGQIKVNFDKYLGKSQKMEVKTPTATLAVRGTSFLSLVLPSGHTIVQVLSGAVRVIPAGSGMPFNVNAGQGTTIMPQSIPSSGGNIPGKSPASTTSDTANTTVYDLTSKTNVSSSSLVSDQLVYSSPNIDSKSATTSGDIVAEGKVVEGEPVNGTQQTTITTNDTSISNSTVQSITNVNEALTVSFDANFTSQFGQAALSAPYNFSFSRSFSGTGLEGKVLLNISKPTLDINRPSVSNSYQVSIFPETFESSSISPNIDTTKSFVKGSLSYSRTGITPQDSFTFTFKGDVQIKLKDPSQLFASYFDLANETTSNFYDSGGAADIGGDLVDSTTAKNKPELLLKGQNNTFSIKINNPYTLPINGFGQSH